MDQELTQKYRSFLKDSIRKGIDFSKTDQHRGIAPPPIEKPFPKEAKRIDLPQYDQFKEIGKIDLKSAIRNRESRRSYRAELMTVEELSFLLWATQGIRQKIDRGHALRTVPSAGCRHALVWGNRPARVKREQRSKFRCLSIKFQSTNSVLEPYRGY